MNDPEAVDGLLNEVPEVATTEEVAELLRVKTGTVLKWGRDFGLKSIAVGPRVRRFRKEDLRAFLLTSDELGGSDEIGGPSTEPPSGEEHEH